MSTTRISIKENSVYGIADEVYEDRISIDAAFDRIRVKALYRK